MEIDGPSIPTMLDQERIARLSNKENLSASMGCEDYCVDGQAKPTAY